MAEIIRAALWKMSVGGFIARMCCFMAFRSILWKISRSVMFMLLVGSEPKCRKSSFRGTNTFALKFFVGIWRTVDYIVCQLPDMNVESAGLSISVIVIVIVKMVSSYEEKWGQVVILKEN
jgi:hypothetical protein